MKPVFVPLYGYFDTNHLLLMLFPTFHFDEIFANYFRITFALLKGIRGAEVLFTKTTIAAGVRAASNTYITNGRRLKYFKKHMEVEITTRRYLCHVFAIWDTLLTKHLQQCPRNSLYLL